MRPRVGPVRTMGLRSLELETNIRLIVKGMEWRDTAILLMFCDWDPALGLLKQWFPKRQALKPYQNNGFSNTSGKEMQEIKEWDEIDGWH